MPIWIQWIIGIGTAITMIGVIWNKVLKPMLRFFKTAEDMVPLLRALTVEFKDTPDAFKILHEIADQFRTDSGSTLKDQVNRLEAAAVKQEANSEALKIAAQKQETNSEALRVVVESIKQMAAQDRSTAVEHAVRLDRIDVKVEAGAATAARIERSAEDAHERADAVEQVTASPGAAADAAAKAGTKDKE